MMRSAYDILFQVNYTHDFFPDGILQALRMTPSADTQRLLLNNGLLLKSFADGFTILYDTNFANTPRTREDVMLDTFHTRFRLDLSDNEFYNYTSPVPANLSQGFYHFTPSSAISGSYMMLHAQEYVSLSDFLLMQDFDESYFIRPFAIIDIPITNTLAKNYTIRFKNAATYWKYILVGDSYQQLQDLAILATADASDSFDGPLPILLPDSRKAILFTSKSTLSLTRYSTHSFQLVENYDSQSGKYKTIIKNLPTPDIRNISRGSSSNKGDTVSYSEVFIQ